MLEGVRLALDVVVNLSVDYNMPKFIKVKDNSARLIKARIDARFAWLEKQLKR